MQVQMGQRQFSQRRQVRDLGSAEVEPNQAHTLQWREVVYLVTTLKAEVRQGKRRQRGQVGDGRPRQVQEDRPVAVDVQALVLDAHRIEPKPKAPTSAFRFAVFVVNVTIEEGWGGIVHSRRQDTIVCQLQ